MLTSVFESDSDREKPIPKEGDLYKIIEAHGKAFAIYYGYYEDIDRQNPACRPIELYPNFREKPVYADGGEPFVTAMQKPCEHFTGDEDEDNTCYQCACYEKCEELLGICTCMERRRRT